MADETKLYKYLVDNTNRIELSNSELARPDPTIEKEITGIFTQARTHRNRLVNFYIWYTVLFTVFVFVLIAC